MVETCYFWIYLIGIWNGISPNYLIYMGYTPMVTFNYGWYSLVVHTIFHLAKIRYTILAEFSKHAPHSSYPRSVCMMLHLHFGRCNYGKLVFEIRFSALFIHAASLLIYHLSWMFFLYKMIAPSYKLLQFQPIYLPCIQWWIHDFLFNFARQDYQLG